MNNNTTIEYSTTEQLITSTHRQQTTQTLPITTAENVGSTDRSDNGDGMDVAVGVAVAFAVIAVVTIIFVILFLWRRKNKKEKNKRPKEQPPDINTLNKIEEEQQKSQKPKKNKKNKKGNKRTVSIISNDPSSMPNMFAPEPPSDPGYANTITTALAHSKKKTNNKFDDYENPKKDDALLYTTGEGSEYYLCKDGNDKKSDTSKAKAIYKNQNFETSVSSTDEKDYVNVPNKLLNSRDTRKSEESGELYEPIEI